MRGRAWARTAHHTGAVLASGVHPVILSRRRAVEPSSRRAVEPSRSPLASPDRVATFQLRGALASPRISWRRAAGAAVGHGSRRSMSHCHRRARRPVGGPLLLALATLAPLAVACA